MLRHVTTLVGVGLLVFVIDCLAAADEPGVDDNEQSTMERAATAAPSFVKLPVPIESDFGEGWKQTVPLDSPITSGESITLWIEDGWLAARRDTASGAVDWQVFLCPVDEIETPMISVKSGLPYFEVTYGDGRYFIRDSDHIFRCRRMPKLGGKLMQKADMVSDEATGRGTSSSGTGLKFAGLVDGEWYHVVSGPQDARWNMFVRLNPDSMGRGSGVQVCATGLTHWHHGDTWLIDDGEFIIANRTLEAFYLAEKKQQAAREAILAGELPAIDATEWLNTDDGPLDWASLKGKVVLVDFWGTWCGPCVAKLPKLQPLHEKYTDQGLTIIAVHSSQAAETCSEFIREKAYTFPVAIDSGKTAEAFAISAWPTYFLIGRDGKLVESYGHDTPTAEAIEALLGHVDERERP